MGVCCHDHAGSIAIWGSARNLVLGDTSGRDKTFSLRTDLRYAIFICDEPLLIWARLDVPHTVQCSVVDAAWHEKEDGGLVPLELTFHTIRLTHPVAAMQLLEPIRRLMLLLTDGSIWEYSIVKSKDGWSVSFPTSRLPPQTVPVRSIEIEGNTVSFELQVVRPPCWLLDFPCIPAAADPFSVLVDVASTFYLGENLVHFTTRINFLHWVVGSALEMCDRGRPISGALAFTASVIRYIHTGGLERCRSWSSMCPVTTLAELENSWINKTARFCLCSWPADVRSVRIAESLTVLKVVHLLQIDLWWLAHSASGGRSPIQWSKWCLSDDQDRLTLTARDECDRDAASDSIVYLRKKAVLLALVDTARPDGDLESLRASLPLHASRTCFDLLSRYHGGWSGWLTRLVEVVADGAYSPNNAIHLAELGREVGLSLSPSPEWLRWLVTDSRLVLTWPAGTAADIVRVWTENHSLVWSSSLRRALSIVRQVQSLTSVCPSLLQTPPSIGVRVPTAPLTRVGSMTLDSVFRCVLPFVDIETACWEALVVSFLNLAQASDSPCSSERSLLKALLLELFQSSLEIPTRLAAARRAAMTHPAGDALYLAALMSSLEEFFLSMGAPEQGPDRQAFEAVLCESDVTVSAFVAFLAAEV